jgi:hypothetical protein
VIRRATSERPPQTESIDIPALQEIDRACFTGLPAAMECKLLNRPGLEPAVILYHPKAELHVLMRLPSGHDFGAEPWDIGSYVEQLNGAVLKQAMGEPPEGDEGYRVDG